jgi:hypothetical protein
MKYPGKTPFNNQYTLKMKDKKVKQMLSRVRYQWEGDGQTKRVKEG